MTRPSAEKDAHIPVLDYDPEQEVWVCADHGMPECRQGDCASLPWSSAERDARCPHDGQSLAWHLVTERDPNDEPRTNADFIGCSWPAELEHEGDPEAADQDRIEDHCPVCGSTDITLPIGITWTKCRGCEASWNAAARVVTPPSEKGQADA